MNLVHSFVQQHWHRWYPAEPTPQLSTLLLTPRFESSGHVIVLVSARGWPGPRLVAKLPRLSPDQPSLRSEAENLQRLEERFGKSATVPCLVAYEEFGGTRVLLETAVSGTPLRPATVRQGPERAIQQVSAWLLELHRKTVIVPEDPGWLPRCCESAIGFLQEKFPQSSSEQSWLHRVAGYCEPLNDWRLPAVFEHGDLSDPNLFQMVDSTIGVVDWETAEPCGPPMTDFFFFLTYVALAKAGKLRDPLAPFEDAFFAPRAWARRYVRAYADAAGIPTACLTPLFVLGWTRYLSSLVRRVDGNGAALKPETLGWLRQEKFFRFWQYSIAKAEAIDWQN